MPATIIREAIFDAQMALVALAIGKPLLARDRLSKAMAGFSAAVALLEGEGTVTTG